MVLTCLFCGNNLVQTPNERRLPISLHLRAFICKVCGWYTEFEDTNIINQKGTYGIEVTDKQ